MFFQIFWTIQNCYPDCNHKDTLIDFWHFHYNIFNSKSRTFWYIKVDMFQKFNKLLMHRISLKNFQRVKGMLHFYLSRAPTNYSFIFNEQLFCEFKHKVLFSNRVCGIFHFWFPFAFIQARVWYFLSNFHFSPNDNPSKTMKNVLYFI